METKQTFISNYRLGEIVFLKLNSEKQKGQIIEVCFSGRGVQYLVRFSSSVSVWLFDYEITTEFLPDYESYLPNLKEKNE